jgi:hypothetical protein
MANRVVWNVDGDNYLRKHYGQVPAKQIAACLGVTVVSVFRRADRLGLTTKMDRGLVAWRKQKIRELNAQGWSDSEIAATVGITRREICNHRKRMGLASNRNNERYRQRVAAKTREQCAKAGVDSLAEIRAREFRKLAAGLGWPEDLQVRSVQILETLYARGPMTRRQLAKAIDIRWPNVHRAFNSKQANGGSYLSDLQHRGLVVRLPKAVSGTGKGSSCDLYMLGLEVEPCHETRSKYPFQRSKTKSPESRQRSPCKAD